MELRSIKEKDPLRQTLLAIYSAERSPICILLGRFLETVSRSEAASPAEKFPGK
jgi:hypothetical protein